MFAILISEENVSKIDQVEFLTDKDKTAVRQYLRSKFCWYFVRGYIGVRGELHDWTVIPHYLLRQSFEYDPDKIITDWDQIVRK